MIRYEGLEIWLITGSQHLYGPEVLEQVKAHSQAISKTLDNQNKIPIKIRYITTVTTPEEARQLCKEANYNDQCIGLITWMHTFSPAKMWINGLKILHKPLLHLHTQFNEGIPWNTIDMDFMNLNQSAHGGREFGFISTRLQLNRKVVVGHWQEDEVIEKIGSWSRVTAAWADSQHLRIARIGDNMREVAVTEGNKVSAQIQFGYAVNGYGLGDLVSFIDEASPSSVNQLLDEYRDSYDLAPELLKKGGRHTSLIAAAKIEVGLRAFLQENRCVAFTDTFENLTGLRQLPGIAVQRLMADGYGFGAEGDWKTAALVRSMKVMAHGLEGGNSFMEDYTYHFTKGQEAVLGAHMLEICPSIAADKPSCAIHPLSIGGKEDPVRLIFNARSGPALNASMIDLGHRFRLLVNEVEAISPEELPNLPVARALWQPKPDLKTAAAAWILAGGAHHTCYSQNITKEHLEDFAEMAGIEIVVIDGNTRLQELKQILRNNEGGHRD